MVLSFVLQDALKNREESNRSYESKLNSSELSLERTKRELKKLESMLGDTEEGSKSRLVRGYLQHEGYVDSDPVIVPYKSSILYIF